MTVTAAMPHKKIKVLLVDDDVTHQYSLHRHLTESSFDVLQARTGAEAVALAISGVPDLVLLDIHLPDLLGFEVCRMLKADTKTRNIPVVFHSATYDSQSARLTAMEQGAVGYLTYPINIDHLISVIRGAVARTCEARS